MARQLWPRHSRTVATNSSKDSFSGQKFPCSTDAAEMGLVPYQSETWGHRPPIAVRYTFTPHISAKRISVAFTRLATTCSTR